MKKPGLYIVSFNSLIFIVYFYEVNNINENTRHMYELSLIFSCVLLVYQKIISDNEWIN